MGSYIYEADLYSRIIVRDGNLDKVDEINFEREIYFFRQHGDYMFIGSITFYTAGFESMKLKPCP